MSRFLMDVSENGVSAPEAVSASGTDGASSFNPAAAPDPVRGQGSVTLTIPAYVTQGNISLTVPAALAQMMLPLAGLPEVERQK